MTVVDLSDDRAGSRVVTGRGLLAWPAIWTIIVVVMAGIVSVQKDVPLRSALVSEAINYYTLGLAGIIVWSGALKLARRSRWEAIVGHFAMALVLIGLWQAIYVGYLYSLMGWKIRYVFEGTWLFQLSNAVVLYGAVLGVTLAVQAWRRQHELALLARDAEFRALTAQLEPHFLLNTLNSINALIDSSPPEAQRMLDRLADLLKAAFTEMQETDVALRREIELARAYLGIEQVRFPDRLNVEIDVPASLQNVRVPPFLLQPIVENAVKHGIAPFTQPGKVRIHAARAGNRVTIAVSDSGPGFSQGDGTQGRGFSLAQRRLRAFAPAGELRAGRGADGAFTVALSFPG